LAVGLFPTLLRKQLVGGWKLIAPDGFPFRCLSFVFGYGEDAGFLSAPAAGAIDLTDKTYANWKIAGVRFNRAQPSICQTPALFALAGGSP
jgi:hypothetical protein